jgi:hypothetical protein
MNAKTIPTTGNTNTNNNSTLLAGRDVAGFSMTAPMVDVVGWTVLGPDGATLGTVNRIMLDATEKKPRYLLVKTATAKGQLLLPIGLGHLNPATKQLRLNELPVETLQKMPLVTDGPITLEFERKVYGTITGKPAQALAAPQLYKDPVFDPMQLFSSKTPVAAKV